jgi:hypothetical protein
LTNPCFFGNSGFNDFDLVEMKAQKFSVGYVESETQLWGEAGLFLNFLKWNLNFSFSLSFSDKKARPFIINNGRAIIFDVNKVFKIIS